MNEITKPVEPSPLALIQQAMERGLDAEQLAKFVDLYHQVEMEHARKAYNEAMRRCQMELPAIVEDAYNEGTKSGYPKFESLNLVIRPIYTRHGFALSFTTGKSELPNHVKVVCDVSHCEGDVRRHEMDLPVDGEGARGGRSAMNAIQGNGSTASYGRRYLCYLIFNIAIVGQDNDGKGVKAYISEEQARELDDMVAERFTGEDVDRFWKWAGFTAARNVTVQRHAILLDQLRRRKPLEKGGSS